MQAVKEKVVSIHYTLTGEDGRVIDSSEGRDPLAYLHGAKNIVPGLERALEGKAPGEDIAVTVPPEEGYGQRNDELVQPVPKSNFPEGVDPQLGMQFQAQTAAGPRLVRVVEVEEEIVTIDANHPLAGKSLNFNVSIVDVRDATPEELQHGHVHSPGGHQH
ncbi:MAG TPA: peptidylprolyl isomerase [Planctomycetaceae bacterium]|nr:peptidylprolyl isomerase [Planctomycetaceae bacterium]